MQDDDFARLYREAMVRDCAALWKFAAQQQHGMSPIRDMVRHADTVNELGIAFYEGMEAWSRERRLCLPDTPSLVCPRCGKPTCSGIVLVRRGCTVMVMTPDTQK